MIFHLVTQRRTLENKDLHKRKPAFFSRVQPLALSIRSDVVLLQTDVPTCVLLVKFDCTCTSRLAGLELEECIYLRNLQTNPIALIAKKPTGMRLHVRCNKANFSSPGVCLHQLLIGRADDICWIIIVEATPPTDVYSSGWVPADVTVWVFLTPCTC